MKSGFEHQGADMAFQELKLIDVSAGEVCGPDGCACGPADEIEAEPVASAVATEFSVEGMTCAHCVASVTKEVGGIAGVESVDIELVPDGRSTIRVGSTGPIPENAVRAAVEEAGYTLV